MFNPNITEAQQRRERTAATADAHAFMQDMFEAFLVQAEESIDTAEARGRFRIHPHFDAAAERKAAAHRMATAACEALVANAWANFPDEVVAIWTPRDPAAAERRAKEMAGVA